MRRFLRILTRHKGWLFGGWIILLIATVILGMLEVPSWIRQIAILLVALTFPLALFLAWAKETEPSATVKASPGRERTQRTPIPPAGAVSSDLTSPKQVKKSNALRSERFGEPGIAVLPFDNMSNDSEIEHIGDGITEDIISSLSAFRHISVPARNSTFVFKGQATDIKEVSATLGVRYVIDGSVRKLGSNIRVTAQFINASSGAHIWAHNYDQAIDDFYETPDDIVEKICGTVLSQLFWSESDRAKRLPDEELTPWEYCLRAGGVAGQDLGGVDVVLRTRRDLNAALELEPDYAFAHALYSWVSIAALINGIWEDDEGAELYDTFLRHLALAREKAKEDLLVLTFVGAAESYSGRQDQALETLEYVVKRNPSMTIAWHMLGLVFACLGRFDDARIANARAKELAPEGGFAPNYGWHRGLCEFMAGEYKAALPFLCRTALESPQYGYVNVLAAICSYHAGDPEAAHKYITQAKAHNPQLTPEKLRDMMTGQSLKEKGERDFVLAKELWDS